MIREKKKEMTRETVMEEGFKLFTERGIECVTMNEVADASMIGRATIFRYFTTKLDLVVEIAAWKWEEYISAYRQAVTESAIQQMTGAEYLRFYLNAFLDLYRNHAQILRFNYNFNSFLRHEKGMASGLEGHRQVVEGLSENFHDLYQRGMKDGTLNSEIPEEEMLSFTFHMMLAAVTRYAVGLVYVSEQADPEKDLCRLAKMLLREFTTEK